MSELFHSLKGKTLAKVTGLTKGGDEVVFETTDGLKFRMYHQQDCCESVTIEDVVGDVEDLIGSPLLVVEETSNAEGPTTETRKFDLDENYTWTFYKLAAIKGSVDIRWLGESNGYYSESVDFELVTAN